MEGFFKKEDTMSLKVTGSKAKSCFSCGLYRNGENPKMEPYGNFKKKVMIIGETPSDRDDRNGKPWQGKTGRLLEKTLEEIGIDLFDDCVSLNSVNCITPENRLPLPKEIMSCRDVKVLKAIDEYQPKLIILLGGVPLSSFLGMKKRSETAKKITGINKWAGWTIPDQDFKTWVCPTYHPTYLEKLDSPESQLIWKYDLKRAFDTLRKPFPIYREPTIHYIDDLEWLLGIETDLAAFDYETTGIKPHAAGHRILSASIAYSPTEVVAFKMPEKKSDREPFIRFLKSDIPKIAQNYKFEDNWSVVRLKTEVNNWVHDTMLESHVLDHRQGTTGLKFQAYVQFGVYGYDDDVSPYIEGEHKDKPGFNLLAKYIENTADGLRSLLKYNALDSFFEYHLALKQIEDRNELINSK
jgi:uracil-DNA glycosylase family 4